MRLNIQSRGMIKGGFVEYSFSNDGNISYNASVTAKVLFFSKTFNKSGNENVPPMFLQSAPYLVVGAVMDIAKLKLTVLSVTAHLAKVNVEIPGYGSGTAILDLSQELISFQSVDLKVSAAGYNVEIVAA